MNQSILAIRWTRSGEKAEFRVQYPPPPIWRVPMTPKDAIISHAPIDPFEPIPVREFRLEDIITDKNVRYAVYREVA